jgi:hypothetical protein
VIIFFLNVKVFIVDFKTFLNSAVVMVRERLVEYLDGWDCSCFWQVCFDRRLDTVEVLLHREWFLNVLLTLNLDVKNGIALVRVEAQSAALVSIVTHFAVITVNWLVFECWMVVLQNLFGVDGHVLADDVSVVNQCFRRRARMKLIEFLLCLICLFLQPLLLKIFVNLLNVNLWQLKKMLYRSILQLPTAWADNDKHVLKEVPEKSLGTFNNTHMWAEEYKP